MESLDLTLLGLAIVFFALWCFSWFIHVVALIYGKWRLYRTHPDVVVEDLPGISILKPLVGVDPNLFENLETFFTMKYPQYELLFCIQDDLDASRMIVQSLIDKYPKIDAKIFIGGKKVGVNPKINNMYVGYQASKYDLIMISDSGIKMDEDTLLDMAVTLREDVGIVNQMPYACTRKGFASHAEKVYFGTQHAKLYLLADMLGINCATGMSTLMRKNIVDEAGGLKEFGQYLAEDYFITQAIMDRGWKSKICSRPAKQNSGTYSIINLQNRLCRWMKLRHAMVPTTIFFEPLGQSIVIGALNSWGVTYLFDWSPLMFFLVHLLLWFILDYILIKIIETDRPLPFSKFEFMVCWILNEVNYLTVIIQAHINPGIQWRGRNFRLRFGGLVEEIYTKQIV